MKKLKSHFSKFFSVIFCCFLKKSDEDIPEADFGDGKAEKKVSSVIEAEEAAKKENTFVQRKNEKEYLRLKDIFRNYGYEKLTEMRDTLQKMLMKQKSLKNVDQSRQDFEMDNYEIKRFFGRAGGLRQNLIDMDDYEIKRFFGRAEGLKLRKANFSDPFNMWQVKKVEKQDLWEFFMLTGKLPWECLDEIGWDYDTVESMGIETLFPIQEKEFEDEVNHDDFCDESYESEYSYYTDSSESEYETNAERETESESGVERNNVEEDSESEDEGRRDPHAVLLRLFPPSQPDPEWVERYGHIAAGAYASDSEESESEESEEESEDEVSEYELDDESEDEEDGDVFNPFAHEL
ncbi:uncharacterized protein [Clytia hemisphaerica]|uniref:uncharacterized protein n=1 Tax=Clytia hemisphaerica TaxID=252671 RepID=UPI0034D4741E